MIADYDMILFPSSSKLIKLNPIDQLDQIDIIVQCNINITYPKSAIMLVDE